jgi:hypothetical protein
MLGCATDLMGVEVHSSAFVVVIGAMAHLVEAMAAE